MRPSYLKQGEPARLFPVLATTSKEGRTTSILLACMRRVDEFGHDLLATIGQRVGKRASVECFTEIVFSNQSSDRNDRPDGLIVLSTGQKVWSALIEAKVGLSQLDAEQIERYRQAAKENKVDCVITISNQFATRPEHHPLVEVRKSRSKIPVFHWSWMSILTTADLLLNTGAIQDNDQTLLLEEFHRFLTHESAGVKSFDRMPPEWNELNKHVSADGKISAKSDEAYAVLGAWHQETRDLTLVLSRQTETVVTERLARRYRNNPPARLKDDFAELRDNYRLTASLDIPNAAAPLEITADLNKRTVNVGMTLRAPEDRKSSRARVNWLLKQVKGEPPEGLQVRLNWPGRSEATQFSFNSLKEDSSIVEKDKESLQVLGFHIYISRRLGGRFVQQANFISDLEDIVPEFYREIGQNLSAWRKSPPKIKDEQSEQAPENVNEEDNLVDEVSS
ncbi:hypothetical protein [Oricola sp.]|uniref:hypothetical protein n=1 Tax=Oricola sp. TaxID=1979950 RepID=UPI003BA8A9E9